MGGLDRGAALAHRWRVVQALTLLVLARLLRRFVPMRRWSGLLGANGAAVVGIELGPLSGAEAEVAWAVEAGSRRVAANCLEQAVAASLMLRARRLPAAVVIGLDVADPGATPHAWLVGPSGLVVTGGELGAFRPVNQFGPTSANAR